MRIDFRADTIAEDQDVGRQAIESAAHTTAAGYDPLAALGVAADATLYLDRCQVDTPPALVSKVWDVVKEHRANGGLVVDFGAGDARFAVAGKYREYMGFEIDRSRYASVSLPRRARMVNACAFSREVSGADLCIGNPPYVRNQDLPLGWRQEAAASIERRTGVRVSGLANAWQYFFMLSLASTKNDGLVAIVIPFEWVSRPSSKALRTYIAENGWDVSVYRLADSTFDGVLTTSSITIVEKQSKGGQWKYFREELDGTFTRMKSPTGGRRALLPYRRADQSKPYAKRGLSPGTQEFLTLTESERAHLGLVVGRDVVPCITSLRHISADVKVLSESVFKRHLGDAAMFIGDVELLGPRRVRQAIRVIAGRCAREDLQGLRIDRHDLVRTGGRGVDPPQLRHDQHAVHVVGVRDIADDLSLLRIDHRHHAVAHVRQVQAVRGRIQAGVIPARGTSTQQNLGHRRGCADFCVVEILRSEENAPQIEC